MSIKKLKTYVRSFFFFYYVVALPFPCLLVKRTTAQILQGGEATAEAPLTKKNEGVATTY